MTDEHDPEEVHYSLVMPFVVTTSHGGPYEDEAFVAGCYFGEIDSIMKACQTTAVVLNWTVPSPLVPQLDLLSAHHGYKMTAEPWEEHPDEWTFVTFEKAIQDPDFVDFAE